MRSTPTEIESSNENDFEFFAMTCVNTPETMFPNGDGRRTSHLNRYLGHRAKINTPTTVKLHRPLRKWPPPSELRCSAREWSPSRMRCEGEVQISPSL